MSPPRPPFIWTRLHLPVPLTVEVASAAIQALATLAGQPRVVLEATGRDGQVSWKLGAPADDAARAVHALQAHLGDLRTERLGQPLSAVRADQAAGVRLRGSRLLPLAAASTEPAARGVLAALSATRRGELVHLQLILGPRRAPSLPSEPVERRQRPVLAKKASQHRFACEIRLGASTADPARTRSLINDVAASLRTLEVPGVRLRLVAVHPRRFDQARSPLFWPNYLSVTDVVPMTGWPIGELPLPGVPPAHPRPLPPKGVIPSRGRVLGVASTDQERPLAIGLEDSLRHLHLLGPTGVGKSTLMARLALADITAGRSTVVIDPKGELIDDLLARIPEERRDDVVVLDARDPAPVGINGLSGVDDSDQAADSLLAVFHSLYRDSWGPRTHDILHACLLTLARRGDGSLAMVPLLLTNPGFRRSVIGPVVRRDPMGLGSFWSWYGAISDAERSQAIAPLMNKLRTVLLRPGIRGIFAQRQSRFQLHQVFTERRILLVSLAKGSLGPEAAQLLGSVLVSLLWNEALRRTGTPHAQRRPVMIHIDEVQDYLRLPGDLGDALAQARGLGVGFTLAHQHLGQLPPHIREAVLANARSRIAFNLTGHDARDLAGLTRGELVHDDFELLPAFHAYASLLVDGSPAPWCSLTTEPLPHATANPADLRARSRQQWGRSLDEVEAELLALVDRPSRGRDGDQLGRSHHTEQGSHQPEGDRP